MKKLFTSFFAALCALNVWAFDFSVDGIYYNHLDGNNVEVTYRGDYAYGYLQYSGAVTIPASVTYYDTTYSVTSIGDKAFDDCSSLTSVTIPNSVTSIGECAFGLCSSLTSITIPNSVTSIEYRAFYYCSSLTSVTIGNSVTSIGYWAFEGCSSLTSVTIGNSVTSIGERAFQNCSSLTSITIPESVTSIGYQSFIGCSSLKNIIWNAKNCPYNTMVYSGPFYEISSQITSFIFGDSVECIPTHLCYKMDSLTNIKIPNSVKSIEEYAFEGCSSITSITIPNNVTSIGSAFRDCNSLSSVIWNAEKCSDDSSPFHNISSQITSFIFGDNVQHITADLCRNMGNLTSITIPNSVTSIGNSAFTGCSGLTSITIPNSVTSIGGSAFHECTGLTSLTIPNSVTSIGGSAFSDCSSVEYLSVSNNNVESIGMWAFFGLDALKEITMKAPSVEDYCKSKLSKLLYDSANINDDAIRKIEINGEEMIDWSIPASVTQIEDYTFYNCPSITSVTLPKTITTIGKSAFENCTSITSMDIPNKVTRIGNNAFKKCPLATITIPNNVTTIGSSAFNSCDKLSSVILGESVDSIGGNAFYGCRKLYDIYCYAPEPPYAVASGWNPSFENTNVNLYVPCDNLKAFQMDPVFGLFKYIHCIDSEDVSTDGVIIAPGNTDVTITWPTEDNADTYAIVIEKDGEVVCTLTFNADGQLLNIAFAPGRDGNHPAQYAEQTTNGYRFTIIGLEEGSNYTYTITIKDASNKTINTHSGAFTTQSTTNLENIDTRHPITDNRKIIRNGQLIIIRDGVEYNAQGQIVKE